jgi:rare lipoprotein A
MITNNPGRHPICIDEPNRYQSAGNSPVVAADRNVNQNGRCRMPFHQTIGISLALLMASAGALAHTQETRTSHHPAQPPNAEPGKSPNRSGKIRVSQRRHQPRPSGWSVSHHAARHRHRPDIADAPDGGLAEPQRGPMHATGALQIGPAAWYRLVGYRTSSGEPLDWVTLTAAHRSLPLGSCARVTSLDNGRSVIVKINDRGPYSRRFIIDLSPRAAQALGMIHAGVAAVAVEPVAMGPIDAVYRGPQLTTPQ